MFCKECGKPIENDASFCSFCGTNTDKVSNDIKNNNAMPNGYGTINVDKNTLITIVLSVGIIISTAFLDIFRLIVRYGFREARIIYKVFSGSGFADGESIALEGAEYDFPLINIMFIVLCLLAVLTIILACMKKRYGVIICGLLDIIVLFVVFLIYCFAVTDIFEAYMAFATFEEGVTVMRLPGIGLVIDFVLSVAMTFFGIFSLSSKKH